jgi:hypothetical protein
MLSCIGDHASLPISWNSWYPSCTNDHSSPLCARCPPASISARAAAGQKRQFDAIEQLFAPLHQIIGPPVEQPDGGEVAHATHQQGHCEVRIQTPVVGARRNGAAVSPAMTEWVSAQFMRASPKGIIECMRAISRGDFRADMRGVTVPTLIVHGEGPGKSD